MKFKFKKVLHLLIIVLLMQLQAMGGTIQVQNIGAPISISNRISQPINLSFATDGNWKLLV